MRSFSRYLRESVSDTEFLQRYTEWAFQNDKLHQVIPLIKPRVERFSDVVPLAKLDEAVAEEQVQVLG